MNEDKSLQVFVYGTLKHGFPNHAACMAEAEYVGRCETLIPYPLVIGGRWHSPCLIDEPGSGLCVQGELYRVDQTMLGRLDRFESCDEPSGYLRKPVDIVMSAETTPAQAWTYFKPRDRIEGIHSDTLAEYLDHGDYVEASKRPPPGSSSPGGVVKQKSAS